MRSVKNSTTTNHVKTRTERWSSPRSGRCRRRGNVRCRDWPDAGLSCVESIEHDHRYLTVVTATKRSASCGTQLAVKSSVTDAEESQPRVRHDLRRGPAPLRRVAVGLRPPVPRADGQARRRLHRGPVAGDLDRPEVGVAQPAVDRRHDHRDLRLPAPAVRRASASRTARTAAGSSPARRRSRSSTACSSCPRARASRCSRPSCAAARASTTACSTSSPGRASPGPGSTARSSSSPTAGASGWPATRTTRSRSSSTGWCAGRASSAGSPTRSRPRCASPRAWPRSRSSPRDEDGDAGRRSRETAHVLRAPRVHALRPVASTSSRRATSRSTRRTARASGATGSARASRSTPSSSSPDDDLSIDDGAIAPWCGLPRRVLRPRARRGGRRVRLLASTRRGRS